MKRLGLVAIFSLLGALIVVLWVMLPPLITRPLPISAPFLTWLRSEHSPEIAERLSDPLEVSLRMLHFGTADPIDTRGMIIHVDSGGDGERIVTIDNSFIEDDSVSRTYSRIRLKREGLSWVPTDHRIAYQGRGVFGWTIGSTK